MSSSITLDFGDTYEGAVQRKNGVVLPHGQGVWRSADGSLSYEGHFVQRWRDGYGRLSTPSFTLWARWRMDRPDLSAATRIDYANGDRYCGFLEWKSKTPSSSKSRSKFTSWASSVEPIRQRWGELVLTNGDAYVGEWKDDERDGFGCYVWATGSRYTGRFRHGQLSNVGTLFVAPDEIDGCFSRLSSGGWRCGEGTKPTGPTEHRVSTTTKEEEKERGVCGVARWPPLTQPAWGGVIVDVVWADGRCRGEGHVTLPGGVRISADWRTASSPMDGELVLPTRSPQARVDPDVYEWHESFQWEALFDAVDGDTGQDREAMEAKVAATRVSIQQSTSAEVVKSSLVEMLNTHTLVKRSQHIFQRCFYGLYGTCGAASEIGAGGGAKGLGWCALRNPYGGCIHPPRGRAIQAGELDLALRDIASLARSTVRWLLEILGPAVQAKVLDCGGEAVVGRWVADRVFQHCYPVLLNLYRQVYQWEEVALAASLARLRDVVSLDDMGVVFARQSESQARLFDPYTDAVHCVGQLNGDEQTLTKMLKVLVQWSREIDLSTRLTQASQDGGRHLASAGLSLKPSKAAPAATAGSADDLLPIHQYVLSQSSCADLYAITKLLSDFANEALFMEATSQEAFGVTTLQVCVLTLQRLHPWERDEACVVVPYAVATDRVSDVALHRSADVAAWVAATLRSSPEDASLVRAILPSYALLWVPRVVGWLAEHISRTTTFFSLRDCDFTREEVALAQLRPSDSGEAACLSCWLFASCLLGSLHVRLYLDAFVLPQRLQSMQDVQQVWERIREHANNDEAPLELCLEVEASTRLIPSRLLRMETHLYDWLSIS